MSNIFTYDRIIALAILTVIYWVILILYRVGKGEVVQKVDYWKSRWKIILWWLVIVVIGFAVLYLFDWLGIINK